MIPKASILERAVEQTQSEIRRREQFTEFGFNPIGESTVDNLNPVQQTQMIRDAYFMWLKNPLANAIIETFFDFVWGDGLTFKAKEEKVQEVLDEYYFDVDNDWDGIGSGRLRDMSIYGELVLKPFISNFTGKVKITSIFPERITRTFADQNNSEKIAAIEIGTNNNSERLGLIKWDERTEQFRGDVFYFGINKTMHQTRGLSDLFISRDWLRLYDKSLYSTMERTGLLLSFVWDITINGATDDQIRKKFNDIKKNPPKPGGFRVHNDKETWETPTPDLRGRSFEDIFRLFKSQPIAGSRMPEHYFGMGGDVNLATARVINVPFLKKVKRRQKFIKSTFAHQFDYVLDKKRRAKMLNGVQDFSYIMALPNPDPELAANIADSLFKFSQSLLILETNGYIDKDTVTTVISMLIGQFGVDVEGGDLERSTESMYDAASKFIQKQNEKNKS